MQGHDIKLYFAQSKAELLSYLKIKTFDAFIIDYHMPDHNGGEIIKTIRRNLVKNNTPIFIFSGDISKATVCDGLSLGINDFLSKMMDMDELVLRIKNGITLAAPAMQNLSLGNLIIDQHQFRTYIDNVETELTFTEYRAILLLVIKHPVKIRYEEIMKYVWFNKETSTSTIRVHISNLKQKLKTWNFDIVGKQNDYLYLSKK